MGQEARARPLVLLLVLFALACGAVAQDPFTVVVLPDTQNYCDAYTGSKYRAHFFAQTRWIAENAGRLDIAFVLHAGDITQTDREEEWEVARKAMSALDGAVPYVLSLGNHDMGYGPSESGGYTHALSRESKVEQYFPRKEAASAPGFGGTFDETLANSWWAFRAGGLDLLVVSLEYKPRDEVLEWANRVVADHPEHRAIVLTHSYLGRTGRRLRGSGGTRVEGNDGEGIWEKFVRRHESIFLVICGHVSGEARAESVGAGGNRVHEVLADYQSLPEGGGSWLRYLAFHPGEDRIEIYTYNPVQDEFQEGDSSCFTLTVPMLGRRAESRPAPVPR